MTRFKASDFIWMVYSIERKLTSFSLPVPSGQALGVPASLSVTDFGLAEARTDQRLSETASISGSCSYGNCSESILDKVLASKSPRFSELSRFCSFGAFLACFVAKKLILKMF